jgi:hypothetical protein
MNKAITSSVHDILGPLGFVRHKWIWNHTRESHIEVVELEASKARDGVTISAGVIDTDVYVTCWGDAPPAVADSASCTVAVRVGDLMENRDVWWNVADEDVGASLSAAVRTHVLPFLERVRSRNNMEEWLLTRDVVRRRYPPPIIALAILQSERGELAGACAMLRKLTNSTSEAWRTRVTRVLEKIGCQGSDSPPRPESSRERR